jgi:outer membrane protein OmpA-like peptidoglycan-associated protein
MGYREPYDFRNPECFSGDSSVPDCRSISPYNYADLEAGNTAEVTALNPDQGGERNIYFPDVNFDFNVRALNDLGRGRVKQIGQLLQDSGDVNVVLEGHTDYIGTPEYNEKLGLDRAEAVRQELLALGIAPERVSTVTFGKSKPIFEEQTDWARAINRRVEVHVDAAAAPAAQDAIAQ